MLNKIFVMGRMVRDPELRRTNTGTAVVSFTLACDRDFKDKQTGERETDFIDCVAWRQTGEFISQHFSKGRAAVVEGRLQNRKWTDKDGNKRVSAEVVVDQVYFADSKNESQKPQDRPYMGGGRRANDAEMAQTDTFKELEDEDGGLPF